MVLIATFDDETQPLWRYRLWRFFHNLFCAECRPHYTFWTARPIPLEENNDE